AFKYLVSHPDADAGIHLTLIIEDDLPPYGPLMPVERMPSLVDENGYFFNTLDKVFGMNGTEISEELDAQIRKAVDAGVDITHLDCHMGFYHGDPKSFKIVLKLAKKYDLPIRLPHAGLAVQLLREGIMTTDALVMVPARKPGESAADVFKRLLNEIKPGITEIVSHPAVAGLDEYSADWRQDELNMWLDPEVIDMMRQSDIRLIGYRQLRDFQRKLKTK
ncbi:MAG: ChbG/HpnK family deacetylase, partial [bacterium]